MFIQILIGFYVLLAATALFDGLLYIFVVTRWFREPEVMDRKYIFPGGGFVLFFKLRRRRK